MNERIRELAEQAHEHADNDARANVTVNYFEIFEAKFAELIVRECARVAMNTDLEDVEGGDSDVLYAAHTQIKQHFGVEE